MTWTAIGPSYELAVIPWIDYDSNSRPWMQFRVRRIGSAIKGYEISWNLRDRRVAESKSLKCLPYSVVDHVVNYARKAFSS